MAKSEIWYTEYNDNLDAVGGIEERLARTIRILNACEWKPKSAEGRKDPTKETGG